jgi:hypothetical protein
MPAARIPPIQPTNPPLRNVTTCSVRPTRPQTNRSGVSSLVFNHRPHICNTRSQSGYWVFFFHIHPRFGSHRGWCNDDASQRSHISPFTQAQGHPRVFPSIRLSSAASTKHPPVRSEGGLDSMKVREELQPVALSISLSPKPRSQRDLSQPTLSSRLLHSPRRGDGVVRLGSLINVQALHPHPAGWSKANQMDTFWPSA